MSYLKYLWLLGVLPGALIIRAAWHDTVEGPYARFFGFVLAVIFIVQFMEAYRLSIIEDVGRKLKDSQAKTGPA